MTSMMCVGRWPLRLLALAVVAAGLTYGGAARAGQPVTEANVNAAVAQLDTIVAEAMNSTGVPGVAVAVVSKDQVLYLKGYGVREAGRPERVDADTVFQIASLSKPISSTIVAALVGDGVTTWDRPVVDYDPSLRLADAWVTSQVTARDFFAHRSGLPGAAGNGLEELGFDRDEILARLRYLKPASSFRSTYAYSNFGMTAGGVAVAKAAGMSWEEAAAARLFRPLGMTSTSARHADYEAATNRAKIHVRIDGNWEAKFTRQPDPQAPAGGVSSTARDLARWLRLQLGEGTLDGREVVKADALEQTHLPQILSGKNPATGGPNFYGLGWVVSYDARGRLNLSHAGAFSVGARTTAKFYPAEGLGIVVLSNAFPTGLPDAVADAFLELALDGRVNRDWLAHWNGIYDSLMTLLASLGEPYVKTPASPWPALPLRAYTGVYANDYVGEVEVVEADGGLVLIMGPNDMRFPLRHFDRDIFTQESFPEPPAPRSGVSFIVGPEGTAQSVMIENFSELEQGVLRRVPPAP